MIHYLINALEGNSDVRTIVDTNIFTLSRLDDRSTPCLVLQMTGSNENESKGFHLNLVTCFVEITAITEQPSEAWALSVATVKALNGYKDSNVISSQFNQWASDIFEADEVFTITMTFTVQIKI